MLDCAPTVCLEPPSLHITLRYLSVDSVFTAAPSSIVLPFFSLVSRNNIQHHSSLASCRLYRSPQPFFTPLANLHLCAPISENQFIAVLEKTPSMLNEEGGISYELCVTNRILMLLALHPSFSHDNKGGELGCLASKFLAHDASALYANNQRGVRDLKYFELPLRVSTVSADGITCGRVRFAVKSH